jgi:sugar/nucleoside kinase (ribokinase family)
MDILYPNVDFTSAAFDALRSRSDGDGGLKPGRLVFADDAERFVARRDKGEGRSPRALADALAGLTGGLPAAENVGGPSIVALVHAAQMLAGEDVKVEFHGVRGDDALGARLLAMLGRTPVNLASLKHAHGRTPSTLVFSDPRWDGGRGERCFVNDLGVADHCTVADLGPDFLSADIVAMGGTGLVPPLHDALPELLSAARSRGALTVVNTVFDFRNERRDPRGPWPLGPPQDGGKPGPLASYQNCDLLVMDRDEALRLSGESSLSSAEKFFQHSGVGAYLITRGGESVLAWSGGGRFHPVARREIPVSERALRDLTAQKAAGGRSGDTTGCGDAFAGGVLASLAAQLLAGRRALDLAEAAGWGVAGGAATLFTLGGTYYEGRAGERRSIVESFHRDWLRQVREE